MTERLVRLDAAGAATILGVTSAMLGIVVLVGWYTDNELLTRVDSAFVPMQYNTALGFVLCGTGLLAWRIGCPGIAATVGVVAAVIGLLTLAEHVFGVNIGLDQLLLKHPHDPNIPNPGRMGPNTALCLLLSGCAIVAGSSRRLARHASVATAALGAMVAGLGVVALLGYLLNVETAYGWGGLTQMAVHTATGFVFVGAGCLAHALTVANTHDETSPVWYSIPVAVVGITISVFAWQELASVEAANVDRETAVTQLRLRDAVTYALTTDAQALDRMASRWQERGGTPRQEWEADALAYYQSGFGYRALQWVDEYFRVRWTVPAESNEAGEDLLLDRHYCASAYAARNSGDAAFSRTVRLAGGAAGFCYQVPVSIRGEFSGLIVGVFDIERFLGGLLEGFEPGYELAFYEGGEEIYRRSNGATTSGAYSSTLDISVFGLDWQLSAWPSARFIRERKTVRPLIALVAGMAVSMLLAFAVHSARLSRLRLREAEEASKRLLELNETLEERVQNRTRALDSQRLAATNLAREAEEAGEEMARLLEKLEQSNEELEQFAYVASHDLQEPLRMVASYTNLIARRYEGKLDKKADKYIHYATDGAKRMQVLINDLLLLSRVRTKAKPFSEVDMNGVVKTALSNLRVAVRESGAEVTTDRLPTIVGDDTQLVSVFQNLIANGIKFVEGRKPKVHISGTRTDNGWRFSVEDNGIGIDAKDRQRIFKVSQRLHDHNRYPGTGIGLAIVKKIIDRHGGGVHVESELGSGSTFRIELPLKPEELYDRC